MSFEVKIFPMQDHHIDGVTAIEATTNTTPWSADIFIKELNSPTHILLVATVRSSDKARDEKILGFTGGQLIGDELHIHSLAVVDDYRRKGVGENLVLSLIETSRKRDAKSATLEVRKGNIAAISLYQKLLFEVESSRKKYYRDNGEDALIMWLHSFDGLKQ